VEAPLNVSEKQLVGALHRVLGGCVEVLLLAGDGWLKSQATFDLLDEVMVSRVIAQKY